MPLDGKIEQYTSPAPKLDEPWRKVALDAADAIRDHGHLKGNLGAPGCGFCILGALSYADHGSVTECGEHDFEACSRLRNFIGVQSLVDWNNDPQRTTAEVIAALEAVARS